MHSTEVRQTATLCAEVINDYFESDRSKPLARVLFTARIELIAMSVVRTLEIPSAKYCEIKELVRRELETKYDSTLSLRLFNAFNMAFNSGVHRFDGQSPFSPANLIEYEDIIHQKLTDDAHEHSKSNVVNPLANQCADRIFHEPTKPERKSSRGESERTTDREIQVMVARCISFMVYYHNHKLNYQSSADHYDMKLELVSIASKISRWGLNGQTESLILQPVRENLIERFGSEVGLALFQEFAEVFDDPFASTRAAGID